MLEPSFMPAAQLSREFYAEVVRPVLGGRPHGAALLGWGSDVLGYDTERSTDHGWGPRLLVFVEGTESVEELQIGQHGDGLPEHLTGAVHARDVTARESALAEAYTALARRHNDAALTNPVDASIGTYRSRPARVLMAGRFTEACLATVTDPMLRGLPLIGAVDQVVDSTDVLEHPRRCRRLAALYTLGSEVIPVAEPRVA